MKEAKILHNAVRREAIKKRIGVNDEKREELESKLKQIGLRDEDREQLEEEYEDVRRTIRRVKKLPDAELFDNRWEEFDWMKIAVKDFALAHSASDCCLYWKNFAHPSINKTSWTEVYLTGLYQCIFYLFEPRTPFEGGGDLCFKIPREYYLINVFTYCILYFVEWAEGWV